jgi:hypothetical protein
MAYEELFNELLKAEQEEDVTDALTVFGLEKYSEANWLPYGKIENNFGLIGAQQADAMGALVEKIVNSIDAVLMRECYARNIDPRSNLTPRSMGEAAEQFLKIPEGNLAKLSSVQRTELAEKSINIVLTGNKPSEGNPCVMVVDSGEGQRADDFSETLVSLLKSNKCSVPFVQGKFNMGSTGSLTYCSPNKNYQLIASRRNISIPGGKSSKWGFTLIRKRPPLKNERNERYEYLAPRGKVCEIDLEHIAVLPDSGGKPYQQTVSCGTILKLYEYALPGSTRTMATTDFYRALSSKLWSVVVPVRIHEGRPFSGHTLKSTFSGMNIRLEDDKGNVLEDGFPCNFSLKVAKVGHIDGRICLFKKNAEISRWISSREAVIYTINGQAHGALPNDFFRRTSVSLPWIQRQLLINVDCSKLDQSLVNRLFMTSRDRQRDVEEKELLEAALSEFIKKHEGLRQWNERRHRESVEQQFADEGESIEMFERLISDNPALAEMFGVGVKIKAPNPGEKNVPEFHGKKYPSYLRIEGCDDSSAFVKKCPQNSYCRVVLLTDVENDYLVRAYDPGKLIIRPEDTVRSTSLYNGRLELLLEPGTTHPVGSVVEIKVMLTSPDATEGYLEVRFSLEVIDAIQTETKKSGAKRPPKVSALSLPEISEIRRERWSEDIEIANEEDVVTIMKEDKKVTSLVNMDNRHFKRYLYTHSKRELEITNVYKISVTIMGLWLGQQVDAETLASEKRRAVSNSMGKILLPLIDSLGSKMANLVV